MRGVTQLLGGAPEGASGAPPVEPEDRRLRRAGNRTGHPPRGLWCTVTAAAVACPDCGSSEVEVDDPRPGEHICRECGAWIGDPT